MNIERRQITVKELIQGYQERGIEGLEGIVAFDGKLNVRPPYQREFVYAPKERDEVIRTVLKNFPLNIMYWAKNSDGNYELMDGQQRTISLCRYAAESERTFAVNEKYYFNLEKDICDVIEDYILDIYICDGSPSEILEWFKIINIAGKPLTPQELRNTAYTGRWLSDAKTYFSKPSCLAYNISKDYLKGSPIRQEFLETALKWISDKDNVESIENYMAIHQHDENASQLWIYFKRVIEWVQTIFPEKRKEMKGIEWGFLYNQFKDCSLDPTVLENEIRSLMIDDDVTDKKGIYRYVLTKDERFLSLRAFSESQKRQIYEIQNGICPNCKKKFNFSEMEGDHITPWSQSGKTSTENCQMLCKDCNRRKSNK